MSWDIFSKSKIQYFLEKLKGKFVQKETGKGLSTNDYTTTDKNKVSKIDTTTTSASGNPISISGLKANQLAVNPIITLEPIQAGSGTPSPSNIRAISGYDKIEVLSCGKNLFDGTYSATGVFLRADGSEYAGTYNISQYISVKANAAYYFSNLSGTTSACICWYNKAKEFISSQSITEGFTATSPVNACYVRASIRNDKTNVCINEGSSAITYESPHKTTDLSESLGQTVYGLTHDVRTGKARVTWKKIVYDGSSDESWTKSTNSFYIAAHDLIKVLDYANSIKCDKLQLTSYFNIVDGSITNAIAGYKDSGGAYPGQNWIYIGISGISDVASLKTWLSNNPIEVCYEVATPTEIQLTPREISLLKDYAYVSTNGTNISLDYHNGELASLSDVAQVGETVNELGDICSSIIPHDISSSFTTNSDFDLRYAIIINNTVYLNFYVGNITSTTVYTFPNLMTANKPKYLTPVIMYPGSNSTPSSVQGAIDSTGQFIIRTGGASLSAAKYEVMAIYRTI